MRIVVKVDVGNEARRALRARQGRPGLATRYEVTSLIDMMLSHDISDAVEELKAKRAERTKRNKRGK